MANEIDFPNPAEVNPFTDINGYIWDHNGVTWIRQTQGLLEEAPEDGEQYARVDANWAIVSHPAAEVPEAPLDVGKTYARGEAQWWEVTIGLGGISDATANGVGYLRKDNLWTTVTIADVVSLQTTLDAKSDDGHLTDISELRDGGSAVTLVEEAPVNGKEYVRIDAAWAEPIGLAGIIFSEGVTVIRPQVEDDVTLMFTSQSLTLQNIYAHIQTTGASVTMNIHFGSERDGVFNSVFNVDQVITSTPGAEVPNMDVVNIPANNWLWVEIIATSGDPIMFHVTADYTK